MEKLRISNVRTDGGSQPSVVVNSETVSDYTDDLQRQQQLQACEVAFAAISTPDAIATLRWFTANVLKWPLAWTEMTMLALLEKNKAGELRWRLAKKPFGLLGTIMSRAAWNWRPELHFHGDEDVAERVMRREVAFSTLERNAADHFSCEGDYRNPALDDFAFLGRPRSNPASWTIRVAAEEDPDRADFVGQHHSMNCPGGPRCTCCSGECQCGCKETCPVWRDFSLMQIHSAEFRRDREGSRDWLLSQAIGKSITADTIKAGSDWLASVADKYSRRDLRNLQTRHARNWQSYQISLMANVDHKEEDLPMDSVVKLDWDRICQHAGLSADHAQIVQARLRGVSRDLLRLYPPSGWDSSRVEAAWRGVNRAMGNPDVRQRFRRAIAGQFEEPDLYLLERGFSATVREWQAQRKTAN